MKVLRGNWQSLNEFIDEDGIEYRVIPKTYIYEEYKHKLPLDCFIQLNEKTIISVVEDTI